MNTFSQKTNSGQWLKTSLCLLLFHLFILSASSQNFILNGGNWSIATNWNGGVVPPNPFTGNSITIAGDANADVNGLTLGNGAKLIVNNTVTLKLTAGSPTTTSIFTNNGDIQLKGNLLIGDNDFFQNHGSLKIESTGSLAITSSLFNNASATLENDGSISVGDAIPSFDILLNFGTIINNGNITRLNGFISQSGGSWSGSGQVDMGTGTLSMTGGSLSPGNSFGVMTVTGNLQFSNGLTLNMEIIGGTSPASDLINVSGLINLGGATLIVSRTSGSFNTSESWDIITAGTLAGSFGSITLPTVPNPPPTIMGTFASGVNGNNYRVTYTGDTFLPIELAQFSGKVQDNNIQLNWITLSELNNDYIIIERSADGLNFRDVGRVDGKGTTTEEQSYTFLDQTPLNGYNYYRLRQVDIDGTEHHSNIIVISMDIKTEGLQLFVYPNPSQDRVFINWRSSKTANGGTVHVIEAATGNIVKHFSMPEGANRMDIQVRDLPVGLYLIQVAQGEQHNVIQFVKH